MSEEKDEKWTTEAYQHSASFVPKLATKVVGWLDVQKDDVILDIGCGDGILDVDFGQILAQGSGSLYGIDASASMICTAEKLVAEAGLTNCKFEVLDATKIKTSQTPSLQTPTFTKVFSNAALHWILRPPGSQGPVFSAIRDALRPDGTLVLEMGGLGCVCEMRTALLMAVARRVGIEKAKEVDPWFFPDEEWLRNVLENEVGGWKIEKLEREWRPTMADKGGVEGWCRLMGKELLDAVPEGEREVAVREVVDVLIM
ncbi:putative methyltransferase [Colletotrichum trifolii]|uniref:Putative methyltransferase n=1 Tax=Colletotrichum trifolii TaxID=5466 RepID=A0A4R8RUB0_COLTR|nr:putative methyltransferase [Colletotrichum trifolii]